MAGSARGWRWQPLSPNRGGRNRVYQWKIPSGRPVTAGRSALPHGPQLSVAKPVQLLWAIFLVAIVGVRGIASGSTVGVTLGAISVAYLAATIVCFFNNRMAWYVAIALPILPLLRWVPMVCLNVFMFSTGHELYRDSPATIVVVAMNAMQFVTPAVVIYFCLFLDRKRLMAVLFLHSTITRNDGTSNADVPVPIAPADGNPYSPPRM
jgi:hypothetical protein